MEPMLKVVIGGAGGRMASAVTRLVRADPRFELVGALNIDDDLVGMDAGLVSGAKKAGIPIMRPKDFFNGDRLGLKGGVYVDLTAPGVVVFNSSRALEVGMRVVVGTTGLEEENIDDLQKALAKAEYPSSMVVTPNFSVGVNIFWELAQMASELLPNYDVEVVEAHHNKKKDSPSGTAAKVAELMAQQRNAKLIYGREGIVGERPGPTEEIGVHAVRAGDIIGDHTVILAGNAERVEITHRLHSREALASGCLAAIQWVATKDDRLVHTMGDVLGISR